MQTVPNEIIVKSVKDGDFTVISVKRSDFVVHRKLFTAFKKKKAIIDDVRHILIWIPKNNN